MHKIEMGNCCGLIVSVLFLYLISKCDRPYYLSICPYKNQFPGDTNTSAGVAWRLIIGQWAGKANSIEQLCVGVIFPGLANFSLK